MIPRAKQRIIPFRVWEGTTPKTGDVANLSISFIKDGVLQAADNAPAEVGNGLYIITATAAEMDGLLITLAGISSTADVYVVPVNMITDDKTQGVALAVQFTAWDAAANAPKTGDKANFSISILLDGASGAAALVDITEIDAVNAPGVYSLAVTALQSDGVLLTVYGSSSTADVNILSTTFATDLGRFAVEPTAGEPIRKQIIDAVEARFKTITIANGYKTNLGNNVYQWFKSQITKAKLPALTWEDDNADMEQETVGQMDNTVTISARISAKTKADVYNAMADLIQALGTDTTFGNLGNIISFDEVGQAKLNQDKIWVQAYGFDIEYATDRFDPYNQ